MNLGETSETMLIPKWNLIIIEALPFIIIFVVVVVFVILYVLYINILHYIVFLFIDFFIY